MIRRRYTLLCLLVCIGARVILSKSADIRDVDDVIAYRAGGESCELHISKDVARRHPPLMLYAGTLRPIRAETGTKGTIRLRHDAAVLLACPGAGNYLRNLPNNETAELVVRCAGGTQMRTPAGEKIDMRRLECSKWTEHRTIANGTCLWGKVLLQTSLHVSHGIVPMYESCFDASAGRTIYSKFVLASDAIAAQRGVQRAKWRGREHFAADPSDMYPRISQRKMLGQLLGSDELAAQYVSLKSDEFLSKGHLAAKTDFLQGAAQSATMQYTNAAPQWQTFNGNNWNALENDVRAFVERLGHDVLCYTGTHGVATLPGADGAAVELYLGANRTLSVPRVFWKVVYDARDQRGVAFIGLNNPHQRLEEAQQEVRCRDIGDQLAATWKLSWRQHDVRRGYSFSCEVNDFRANFADVLPAFAVVGILR